MLVARVVRVARGGGTRQDLVVRYGAIDSAGELAASDAMIGMTVRTDKKNRYSFTGTLEIGKISGWGFDRSILLYQPAETRLISYNSPSARGVSPSRCRSSLPLLAG